MGWSLPRRKKRQLMLTIWPCAGRWCRTSAPWNPKSPSTTATTQSAGIWNVSNRRYCEKRTCNSSARRDQGEKEEAPRDGEACRRAQSEPLRDPRCSEEVQPDVYCPFGGPALHLLLHQRGELQRSASSGSSRGSWQAGRW